MVKFAADENFNGKILAGLQQNLPDLDLVRVQDTEMYQKPDDKLLDWTLRENRILLTHDRQTMIDFAKKHMIAGKPLPGLVVVSDQLSIGQAIEHLTIMISCNRDDEWENQIAFIPI